MKELIRAICKKAQPEKRLEVHDIASRTKSERKEVLSLIRSIISESLKIPVELVEDDYPFDEYGIDSMTNLSIIKQFEMVVGPLPKTLFFEYNTVEELADYFIRNYAEAFSDRSIQKESEKKTNPTDSTREAKRIAVPWESSDQDIAIIGVSGRYPQARNLDEFWENLKEGKDCITEVPKDRWDFNLYYSPDKNAPGKSYLKEGGFIDGVYEFDPLFFSTSPREAKYTDPQDRLFLQCCYETLEDAGYTRNTLKEMNSSGMSGNVGVFAGVMWEEYQMYGAQEQILGNPVWMTGYPASIANKVSYFFNLHGPSMTVDTMCSSSLTALHLACQSIRDGECDAAIAGGVNLSIHPNKYFLLSNNKFASSRGRCESFGDKGDGYVPGEGVGAVMLKPLAKAEADGDQIYGVIKATAVNHGGKTSGYTVPNPNAQANVIEAVYRKAGINPRTISYMEAHGTGTSLGDPIEIAGLEQVFDKYTEDKQFCSIGSVKSNIGHLEGAAGIVSLTKVLLQMKHKKIVPSLHSQTLNPYIDFANSPFTVPQKLQNWERPQVEEEGIWKEYPRRASISSFGAGGSNAHVLIEEYERKRTNEKEQVGKAPYAIVISARQEEQVKKKIEMLYDCIRENYQDERYLEQIAFMLQTGRENFDYRICFEASSINEVLQKLKFCMEEREFTGCQKNHVIRNAEQVKKLASLERKNQMEHALAGKDQVTLMMLWAEGFQVDWKKLYKRECVEKLSLPTYPFARDIYCGIDRMKQFLWEDGKNHAIERKPEKIVQTDQDNCELMTFLEQWTVCEASLRTKNAYRIVCIAQDSSLKQIVKNEAEIAGKTVEFIWILCQDVYEKKSNTEYTIEYEQKSNYIACLNEIKKDFGTIDQILYLNPLHNKVFQQEVSGLIALYQALHEVKLTDIQVVLAGVYENELERAYVESWIGMDRSVGITSLGISIEVVLNDSRVTDTATVIHNMLTECFSEYQGSVWYDQGVRKILKMDCVELKEDCTSRLKEQGTYLITGGMGGLGILFAKHIAQKWHGNIILTGRRSKDDVRTTLTQLRQAGMQVIYVEADVANLEQMRQVVRKAKQTFGRIDGVLHVAGLSEGKNIIEKDYEEYQKILKPKVQGTLTLDKVLEGEPLDFICYFSSSSAILGDFGSFDYAVGNRFLMSYASYRRTQKNRKGETFVIEWPLWKDGGMGFQTEAAERMYLKTSGQKCIRGSEGTAFFENMLQSKVTDCLLMYGVRERIFKTLGIPVTGCVQKDEKKLDVAETMVMPVDTDKKENLTREEGKKVEQEQKVEKRGKGYRDNRKGWSCAQCIMSDLKELVNDILCVPFHQMDENLNLADFGFDSITLSAFASRISSLFALDVTPDLFYRYATLRELTEYFVTDHKKVLEVFYAEGNENGANGTDTAQVQEVRKEDKAVEEHPKEKGKELDCQPAHSANGTKEAIAVIGMSGRFPDARDTDGLWEILAGKKQVIREIPKRKGWDEDAFRTDHMKMGVVDGIDEFDPAFFDISPREACSMDPRQRLLLEETWKALEDAGIGEKEIQSEKIGMFVGTEDGDYQYLDGKHGSITSNHNAILAARLAYFLNLNGPNMSINTACSSGLVAVHQACQSLRTGECDIAIAAGVNLLCTPVAYKGMEEAGMLSPDRTCYAFDKRADGMVPAEAVAVVVLKKSNKAENDKNVIYGEIIGSGINYDGRTNGITAPSGKAQSMLLEEVYEKFHIDPKEISYIVTHGTGTRIGDPIEINALASVFKKANVANKSCALTSTKPNIGHALAASGVVSLISLMLALQNEMIPGEINCEERSDYINWEECPFYLNTENRIWKEEERPRMAAVNAFGMSGTNAHIVVRSRKKQKMTENSNFPAYFIALSAKTKHALEMKCREMIDFIICKKSVVDLRNISYTLLDGRQHFAHRIAFFAQDEDGVKNTLQLILDGKTVENCCQNEVSRHFRSQRKIQQMVNQLCMECQNKEDTNSYLDNLNALSQFYCMGYQVSGVYLYGEDCSQKIKVPYYPFERKSYWLLPSEEKKKSEEIVEEKKENREETKAEKIVARPVVAISTPRNDQFAIENNIRNLISVEEKQDEVESIMKQLAVSLAAELFLEEQEVDFEKGFLEMGLDSIVGVEWVKQINQTFHINMESTKIYQYPTIAALAMYIDSLQGNMQENKHVTRQAGVVPEKETVIPDVVTLQPVENEAFFEVRKQENTKELVVLSSLSQPSSVRNESVQKEEKREKELERTSVIPSKQATILVDLEEIMKDLAVSLAEELFMEVEDVEYDKGFMEMGLDSIVGVEWIQHINKKYNIHAESTKIYQYPTIAELAGYVAELCSGRTISKERDETRGELSERKIEKEAGTRQNTITKEDDFDAILYKIYEGTLDLETAQTQLL